jgi:general secretion pathway protein G
MKTNILGRAGFSLMEMMIVIALIALVGTFVSTKVIRSYEESKYNATKIQMRQLGVILDNFYRVCGFYPTTDQGLDALATKPQGRECKNYDPEGFIKKVPKDAWDENFNYVSDGTKYEIKSLGRDKKEGGEGFDKDILSGELD